MLLFFKKVSTICVNSQNLEMITSVIKWYKIFSHLTRMFYRSFCLICIIFLSHFFLNIIWFCHSNNVLCNLKYDIPIQHIWYQKIRITLSICCSSDNLHIWNSSHIECMWKLHLLIYSFACKMWQIFSTIRDCTCWIKSYIIALI